MSNAAGWLGARGLRLTMSRDVGAGGAVDSVGGGGGHAFQTGGGSDIAIRTGTRSISVREKEMCIILYLRANDLSCETPRAAVR